MHGIFLSSLVTAELMPQTYDLYFCAKVVCITKLFGKVQFRIFNLFMTSSS